MGEPSSTPRVEPAAVLDYATRRKRRWRAGTLTYTSAGLVLLFFWLLWGDFSLQLKERSVPPTLQLLLKRFHASDFILGLLITSLPQTIGLFVTPVVSYISDRFRSRWGRRIPFLLATAPLALASMLGLAYSPQIGHWFARVAHLDNTDASIIASFGIFWGLFELGSIPVNYVLFAGLINDVVPRELLGRFYGLFRTISLGAGIFFFYSMMGKVEDHYVPLFLVFGAIYAASFTLMCFMVKEGKYDQNVDAGEIAAEAAPVTGELIATGATPVAGPSSVLPPRFSSTNLIGAIKTYFRESFQNPYYYWFFASFALAQMAFTPINTFTVPFAKHIGLSMDTYGKLSALQLFLSLAQAYAIGWLCDRFHPLRMTILAMALYAVVSLLAFFLVKSAFMFGFAHVFLGSIAGFWYTATAPLGPAMLPKRKFTTMLSANHICVATGMLIIAPACGEFLDAMHTEYRFIYLWACIFMCCATFVTLILHRRFMQLGGPKHYVAPE